MEQEYQQEREQKGVSGHCHGFFQRSCSNDLLTGLVRVWNHRKPTKTHSQVAMSRQTNRKRGDCHSCLKPKSRREGEKAKPRKRLCREVTARTASYCKEAATPQSSSESVTSLKVVRDIVQVSVFFRVCLSFLSWFD